MMASARALFRREMLLSIRSGSGALLGLTFFGLFVTVTPFAIGPDMNELRLLGPAILWLGALLATILTLDRLFQADYDCGMLAVVAHGPLPLELSLFIKTAAHWLANVAPLVLAAPLFSLFLNLEAKAILYLTLTLLAGTPGLVFLGSVGAAVTTPLRRGGLLYPILLLPLCVPTLIFGVSAARTAIVGPLEFGPPFLILIAISLFAIVIGPIAAAAALRLELD
jgi:heme exporter protein B